MSEHDLAYLAGAIDADGWVGIFRAARQVPARYSMRVALEQCESEAVELAQSVFGGNIQRRIKWGRSWRPSFHWEANGAVAERVLLALLPYLRIKHQQATYALRYRAVVGDGRKAGGRGHDKTAVLRFAAMSEAFYRGMRGLIALRKARVATG